MKTVLCFGDSNTWGSISSWEKPAKPSERFDENTRWCGVLKNTLGADYRVVEEGLCGRTSVFATREEPFKNGEPYLYPCIMSHRPLDLVVIMLGSNDIRTIFQPERGHLGDGVGRLADIIKGCHQCGVGDVPPKILIIAPVHLQKPEGRDDFYNARGQEDGVFLSHCFAEDMKKVAEEKGCYFMDASLYGHPAPADGLHMDAASHKALGAAVAQKVKEILEA